MKGGSSVIKIFAGQLTPHLFLTKMNLLPLKPRKNDPKIELENEMHKVDLVYWLVLLSNLKTSANCQMIRSGRLMLRVN